MQLEKKLFCHWDLFRFLEEEHIINENITVSIIETGDLELMIFLAKQEESLNEYEVRVYKTENTGKYIPFEEDNVKSIEENDEYITFIFNDFKSAHNFVDWLPYNHPEYRERPTRPIIKNE